jgi:hypothetical protein
MAATLATSRSVKIDGISGEWVIRDQDTQSCNDLVYIKVDQDDSRLSSFLGNRGGYRCMRRSIGLTKLFDMRNKQLLKPDVAQTKCTLFDDVAAKSRPVYESRTPAGSYVEVQVGGTSLRIKMLVSSHRSRMYIAYEADSMEVFFKYVLQEGFRTDTLRHRDDAGNALAAGIWRHARGKLAGCCSVAYSGSDGNKRRKYLKSIEDAIAFHENPADDESSSGSASEER